MIANLNTQPIIHIEYRNATYYGQLSNDYKRNGKGMLILDSSTIIFADWNNNTIDGSYVYLADGLRAYGQMNNGKLDGYNVVTSTGTINSLVSQSNQRYSSSPQNMSRTLYAIYRNDKIYGRAVIVDNQYLTIAQYNNNQLEQILSRKPLKDRQVFSTLENVFPRQNLTLDEFLTAWIKSCIDQIQQQQQISRFQPCITVFSPQLGQKFYGFQEISSVNKKFGIIMINNQLVSIGEHNNNILEGIGRLYISDHVYDGTFKDGKISGIGIDFHYMTNKFTLQIKSGNDTRIDKGYGFPLREILQYRKQFHLRSIFFYNDIAILGIKTKFDILLNQNALNFKKNHNLQRDYRQNRNQQTYQRKRSRSTSRKIGQSPMRNKLSKYEMQVDQIEDPSPVKPTNEYKPIDRSSMYFNNSTNISRTHQNNPYYRQGIQAQNNRTYNNRNQTNENSRKYYPPQGQYSRNNIQDRNQRFSRGKSGSRSKFQEREMRQKETYNEILRQNSHHTSVNNYIDPRSRAVESDSRGYGEKNFTPNRSVNSGSISTHTRGKKDTKELLRQLGNEEKEKRLSLDEFYAKANLYGKKR